MKDCEYEFRVDAFHSPEFRFKFYDLLDDEKSKGNLSYRIIIEETAPPPELIKDIVTIVASSLTIVKILYDFWKATKKKNGSVSISVNNETLDLEAHNIDEIIAKIELNKKPITRKFFCRLSFPNLPKEEIAKSARTLSNRKIIFDGVDLEFPDNKVFFAEENLGCIEVIVHIRDQGINNLIDKGRVLYATAEVTEHKSILNPEEKCFLFTALEISSTTIPNGCELKEILRKEDYPEWYRV